MSGGYNHRQGQDVNPGTVQSLLLKRMMKRISQISSTTTSANYKI